MNNKEEKTTQLTDDQLEQFVKNYISSNQGKIKKTLIDFFQSWTSIPDLVKSISPEYLPMKDEEIKRIVHIYYKHEDKLIEEINQLMKEKLHDGKKLNELLPMQRTIHKIR